MNINSISSKVSHILIEIVTLHINAYLTIDELWRIPNIESSSVHANIIFKCITLNIDEPCNLITNHEWTLRIILIDNVIILNEIQKMDISLIFNLVMVLLA